MRAHHLAGIVLGWGLTSLAVPCRADDAPDTPPPAPIHDLLAVDFEGIPKGTFPPMPSTDGAPAPAAEGQAQGLSLQKVAPTPPRRRAKLRPVNRNFVSGLAAKTLKPDLMEVTLDHPELAALYVPDPAGSEFSGDSIATLACHQEQPPSPLRWETLTISGDSAQVDVKDLWFESPTCSVAPGSSARVTFGAIASHAAKPWLYAMRDDRSVTFLFPRATDVTVDAIVGAPVTVQGGFSRVTLPLGRWGATSFVAHLPSLDIDVPSQPPARPVSRKGRGQAARPKPQPPQPSSDPVEIAVELVQTMSERTPTLLVRCSGAEALPRGEEGQGRTLDEQ